MTSVQIADYTHRPIGWLAMNWSSAKNLVCKRVTSVMWERSNHGGELDQKLVSHHFETVHRDILPQGR